MIHLVDAALLLLYVYTPLGSHQVFSAAVRFVAIPQMVVTGLVMWQLPRLIARVRRRALRPEDIRRPALRAAERDPAEPTTPDREVTPWHDARRGPSPSSPSPA